MPKRQPALSRRYPTPEEIPHIISRRNLLAQKLIATMVVRQEDASASDRMMDAIVREYGRPEVARMMGRLLENLRRPDDPEAEAAQIYAAYVASWRRFGAGQPLLSAKGHQRRLSERAALIGKEMLKEQKLSILRRPPSASRAAWPQRALLVRERSQIQALPPVG